VAFSSGDNLLAISHPKNLLHICEAIQLSCALWWQVVDSYSTGCFYQWGNAFCQSQGNVDSTKLRV